MMAESTPKNTIQLMFNDETDRTPQLASNDLREEKR